MRNVQYRSYEEFEREELRWEMGTSASEAVENMFYGELDFEAKEAPAKKADDDDDEE